MEINEKNPAQYNRFYFYRCCYWLWKSVVTLLQSVAIFVLIFMSHLLNFSLKKDYSRLDALVSLYFSCCCLSLQKTYIFKGAQV
jgi:hypothetical protein